MNTLSHLNTYQTKQTLDNIWECVTHFLIMTSMLYHLISETFSTLRAMHTSRFEFSFNFYNKVLQFNETYQSSA